MLAALGQLEQTLRGCAGQEQALIERIAVIRRHRIEGKGYRDSAMTVERPLIAEMLTHLINDLIEAGSKVRKAQAAALHAEGMTMDQIAELFGVSRQRVSALLRDGRLAQAQVDGAEEDGRHQNGSDADGTGEGSGATGA